MYNMNISIRSTIISKREEEGSVTPDQEQVHHDVLPQGRDQQVQVQGGASLIVLYLYIFRCTNIALCRTCFADILFLHLSIYKYKTFCARLPLLSLSAWIKYWNDIVSRQHLISYVTTVQCLVCPHSAPPQLVSGGRGVHTSPWPAAGSGGCWWGSTCSRPRGRAGRSRR